jgi:hypothetical protein
VGQGMFKKSGSRIDSDDNYRYLRFSGLSRRATGVNQVRGGPGLSVKGLTDSRTTPK